MGIEGQTDAMTVGELSTECAEIIRRANANLSKEGDHENLAELQRLCVSEYGGHDFSNGERCDICGAME